MTKQDLKPFALIVLIKSNTLLLYSFRIKTTWELRPLWSRLLTDMFYCFSTQKSEPLGEQASPSPTYLHHVWCLGLWRVTVTVDLGWQSVQFLLFPTQLDNEAARSAYVGHVDQLLPGWNGIVRPGVRVLDYTGCPGALSSLQLHLAWSCWKWSCRKFQILNQAHFCIFENTSPGSLGLSRPGPLMNALKIKWGGFKHRMLDRVIQWTLV